MAPTFYILAIHLAYALLTWSGRVVNALRTWIEMYLAMEDEQVLEQVLELIDLLPDTIVIPIRKAVRNRVRPPPMSPRLHLLCGATADAAEAVQREGGPSSGPFSSRKTSTTPSSLPPISKLPKKKITLLDLEPLEMARQLTLIESALFREIRPFECLDKSWSQVSDPLKAPNIKAGIKLSNEVRPPPFSSSARLQCSPG